MYNVPPDKLDGMEETGVLRGRSKLQQYYCCNFDFVKIVTLISEIVVY